MKRRVLFALLLMGFTSIAAQTLLIREFFIAFNGNELTIGIVLANWILLVALGSIAGNHIATLIRRPMFGFAVSQVGIALSLPIVIFLTRTVKGILGIKVGEGAGIVAILSSSFLIPLALGLFVGLQFPFGTKIAHSAYGRPEKSAGMVYVIDAIGFMIGGPVITYLLIVKLNSFSAVFLLGAVNIVSAVSLLKMERPGLFTRPFFLIAAVLSIPAIISLFGLSSWLNELSLRQQWKGFNLKRYQNSIYGNLAVTKNEGQYTFYSNGIPIITTPSPDIASTEELAHFSMSSASRPKTVLLMGGGAGGMIAELLKYDIEKLTYVELDPLLIRLVNDFPTELTKRELGDKRLDTRYMDGRLFLKGASSPYDVVLMHLPAPYTLELNRFYTKEFFEGIRRILNEDGVFAFTLPGSLSYLGPELKNLNASVLNTLKGVFSAAVIPGYSNVYIASRNKLILSPESLLKRLEERGIHTETFNISYLRDRLDPQWLDWFNAAVAGYGKKIVNSDLAPISTYYAVTYWNSLFSPRFRTILNALDKLDIWRILLAVFVGGLGIMLAGRGVRSYKKYSIGFAILSTGFAGMSLNLILIYAYQSFYGLVFHHIALLVSAFMAGLAIGGFSAIRLSSKLGDGMRNFLRIEFSIICLSVLVGLDMLYMSRSHAGVAPVFFFLLSAIAGFFVGAEFPLANKLYLEGKDQRGSAGLIYALDLLGSWLAAIFVSVLLVPIIGVVASCLLVAAIKGVGFATIALSPRLN